METLNYKNHEGEDKRITLIKQIGKGAFGVVYEALLDGYGAVAVKQQKMSPHIMEELKTEISLIPLLPVYSILLKKIILNPKHELSPPISDIPKINISFSEEASDGNVYSVYELVDGFGLDKIIKINKNEATEFSIPIFKRYVNDLLQGLLEMKKANVAHRDIKPANIMLSRGTLKYIDFGTSCFVDKCKGRMGSPNYLPPEYYKQAKITNWRKMDIFAVGTTIMVMITGSTIWQSLRFETLFTITSFCSRNTYEDMMGYFATGIMRVFKSFPEFKDFIPLVIAMTQPDPDIRQDIEECIEFFNFLVK